MSVTTTHNPVVLEPASQAVVEATAKPPFLYELSPAEARAVLDEMQAAPIDKLPVNDRWTTVPADVGDVRVRIVRPPDAVGTLPVILYMHGGGWVLGNADTHDRLVRELAVGTGAAVVFVEYDRSPEARYPVALEQGYATAQWIVREGAANQLDPSRIAVAGDSVGGNMTAALTLMAQERGDVRFVHQSMYYPVTDAAMDTGSYEQFAEGYFLTAKMMAWFWDAYEPDVERRLEPFASPLRAGDEQLAGLPPAFLIVGEADVLRDEGEAYAARLRAAGRRGHNRPLRRHHARLHDAQRAQRHARDARRDRAGDRRPAQRPEHQLTLRPCRDGLCCDLPTPRRVRRAAEVELLGDRDEIAQQPQLHAPTDTPPVVAGAYQREPTGRGRTRRSPAPASSVRTGGTPPSRGGVHLLGSRVLERR